MSPKSQTVVAEKPRVATHQAPTTSTFTGAPQEQGLLGAVYKHEYYVMTVTKHLDVLRLQDKSASIL